MFAQLVQDYLTWTNDLTTERQFIAGVVWHLDQEFQFWQSSMVNVTVGAETHQLARYWVDVGGPRPGQCSASFAAEQFLILVLQNHTKKTTHWPCQILGLATETFGTDTSRVEQNQVNMYFLE